MPHRFLSSSLVLAMVVAGVTASTNATAAPVGRAKPHKAAVAHISIGTVHGQYAFLPHKIVIRAGTIATWTNHSNAFHTVTEANSTWTSAAFTTHKSYSHHFSKPGTYHYVCALHGYMTGIVVVTKK